MSREDQYRALNRSRWSESDVWYQEQIPAAPDGDDEMSAPWDFPPGSPGFRSGPEPSQAFLDWLGSHDDRMVVGWQPVTSRWTVWRRKDDGGYSLVMPCQNPFDHVWADLEPGEAMPELDQRIRAILIDSDPRTYGSERKMSEFVAARMQDAKRKSLARALDIMIDARSRALQFVKVKNYGKGNKVANMYH